MRAWAVITERMEAERRVVWSERMGVWKRCRGCG